MLGKVALLSVFAASVCQGIVPEDMPKLSDKDLREIQEKSKEKQKQMLNELENEFTNVVKLDSDNYLDYLANNSKVLVEYYAPWCGHCKALAPIYEVLANQTLERGSPIKIAKLDATEENIFEKIENIQMQGYPHLVLWEDGEIRKIFEGEKTLETLTEFVRLGESPSVFTRTLSEFQSLLALGKDGESYSNEDGQLSEIVLKKITDEFNEGKEQELERVVISFSTRNSEGQLSKPEKRFFKLAIGEGSTSTAFVTVLVSSEEAQSSSLVSNLFGKVSNSLSLNSKSGKMDLRRGIYIIRVKNTNVDEQGPNVVGFNLVTKKKKARFKKIRREFISQWNTYHWDNFVDCDNTLIVAEEPEEWDPLRVEPRQENCGLLFEVSPKDRTDVLLFGVPNNEAFINGKFAELQKSLVPLINEVRLNFDGGITDSNGDNRRLVFGFARQGDAESETKGSSLSSDTISLILKRVELIKDRPLHKMDSDMTMMLEEDTHKLLQIDHLFKMQLNLGDQDIQATQTASQQIRQFIQESFQYDIKGDFSTAIREKVLREQQSSSVVEYYPSLALGNVDKTDPFLPPFDREEYEKSEQYKLKQLALDSKDLTLLSDSKDLITLYAEDFNLIALDPSVDTVVLYVSHDYNKCQSCEGFLDLFRRVRRYISSEYTNQKIMRSIIFTVYNQGLEFTREIEGQLPGVVLYPKGTSKMEDGIYILYGPREFSVKTKEQDRSNFILFLEEFTGTLQPDRYAGNLVSSSSEENKSEL